MGSPPSTGGGSPVKPGLSTPPTKAAGDPPAARSPSTPPPQLAGDPPVASVSTSSPKPCGVPPAATATPGPEEQVDYSYSDTEVEGSPADRILKTADILEEGESQDVGERRQLRSVVVKPTTHRVSYKEALTGARTFKPRFNEETTGGGGGGGGVWSVERRRQRGSRATVWARLGRTASIHDRLGEREWPIKERLGPCSPPVGSLLLLLRAKAVDRCFNCFARDHRIAQCRDPPRCILCSRSGHKARYCKAAVTRGGQVSGAHSAAGSVRRGEPKATKAAMEEFIPGEPDRRPEKVVACAGRTAAIREAERDVMLHTLLGVQLDARVALNCDVIGRDALQQLRIPEYALSVSKVKAATFLLRFERPEQRNAALGRGLLAVGRTQLHVMPWTRQFGAASSKLKYRVRVCIEGVPAHAAQVEPITKLFPSSTFVEKIDSGMNTEDERACVCVWVWTPNPDEIAKEGVLWLEEPFEFTGEYMELPKLRNEEVGMLDYKVILHIDRLVDYTPPARSSSWKSYESDVSGIPSDDSVDEEWPAKHSSVWHLGVPDGRPDPRRVSVHDRLGGRRRDRSPPGDGNGGLKQFPPASWHDIGRGRGGRDGAGCSRHGGFGHQQGGGYRRRDAGREVAGEGEGDGGNRTGGAVQQGAGKLASIPEKIVSHADPKGPEPFCLSGERIDNEVEEASDGDILSSSGMARLVQETVQDLCAALAVQHGQHGLDNFLEADPMREEAVGGFDQIETTPVDTGSQDDRSDDPCLSGPDGEGADGPQLVQEYVQGPQEIAGPEEVNPENIVVGGLSSMGRVATELSVHDMQKSQAQEDGEHAAALPFTKKLAKPILDTPPAKKVCSDKQVSAPQDSKRRSTRLANKPKSDLTAEQQATALLMKKCGALGETSKQGSATVEEFTKQFVGPLQDDTVSGCRELFGLPDEEGADPLSAIAIHAEA
ncbi:hypothetical protein C2845_PM01G27360 [Panicum miliaceum]|uniref:CCHC-type domain-containing protein n=1 Tax=Panicum miliaceum TaxID=4540 RepID=A0A3L6TF79_PANMI|nr:hypothetical protein C2845_PM01G27360 [Panicum miliaceum]